MIDILTFTYHLIITLTNSCSSPGNYDRPKMPFNFKKSLKNVSLNHIDGVDISYLNKVTKDVSTLLI